MRSTNGGLGKFMVDDTIKGLNPQQADAVQTVQGPMLILAGAGSGKTKVLTCRIAHLLNQGVRPYRILAITFTNKAAAEMRERVDKMAGEAAKDVWLHTFHAFCAKLLRMEIDKLGTYTNNFAIYDTTDTKSLVKQILQELNLDEKRFQPAGVIGRISNAKNQLKTAEDYAKETGDFYESKVAEIYARYEAKLQQNNALDFDDLLLVTLKLLQENEAVRTKYQDKFDYIMVDEYQDTNHAQYLLTKLLAAKHKNICVVGDADQSIYGWRGADITNILDFEKDYPEAKLVKLEQNYRSTQVILDAANAVIDNNTGRKPKICGLITATAKKLLILEPLMNVTKLVLSLNKCKAYNVVKIKSWAIWQCCTALTLNPAYLKKCSLRAPFLIALWVAPSSTNAKKLKTSSLICV